MSFFDLLFITKRSDLNFYSSNLHRFILDLRAFGFSKNKQPIATGFLRQENILSYH